MFNNKRIAALEAQVNKLTAIIEGLEELIQSNIDERIETAIETLDEKIDEAIEEHDFSEAARDALESIASDATFAINF
jgi:regulator of replication initiation timing